MIVCRHGKGVLLGKLHHHYGFRLILLAIGMRTVVEVGIVAVEVGIVGIVATGAIDGVVAPVIGAVGVGAGAGRDENVELVEQIQDPRIIAGAKFVNEAEHEHHACQLVAMDGGSVKKLGLAIRFSVVEAAKHELASARQCVQIEVCAPFRKILGISLHHVLVGLIGRIGIPIVSFAVRAVPHGVMFLHGRRHEQRGLIAHGKELAVLLFVGITNQMVAFQFVDGTKTGEPLGLFTLL